MPACGRLPLRAGITHVLYFEHYCGASRMDRMRGRGLWSLMTAAEYAAGLPDSTCSEWSTDGTRAIPVRDLSARVSRLLGCPVTLTRSDHPKEPGWLIAYQVSRR